MGAELRPLGHAVTNLGLQVVGQQQHRRSVHVGRERVPSGASNRHHGVPVVAAGRATVNI